MGRSRRKKKKSHVEDGDEGAKVPQTFVMERGKVGKKLSQLVLDFRKVMQPYTASKLKVRQQNVLKDFAHVAGILGVTHLVMVSRTKEHVSLRVARLPRGPTITFRVKAFSLTRDVVASMKKPVSATPLLFLTPALLVLNSITTEEKPMKLMSTMMQNMFPSIKIQTVKLSNLKRCALFHFNKESETVEFRHYCVKVVPRGMSRGVRKIAQSKVPDLGQYTDISEFVLGGGVSESEGEEMESQVTLPQDLPGRGNIKQQQSAVKLTELGPRMTLQLFKIEAGLCTGEVLYHSVVTKTPKELRQLRKRHEKLRALKAQRRRVQEQNVLKKCQEKEMKKRAERRRQGLEKDSGSEGDSGDADDEQDDAEWYRREVGVEPEPELLLNSSKKRKAPLDERLQLAKRRKMMQMESRNRVKRTPPVRNRAKRVSAGIVFRKKASMS